MYSAGLIAEDDEMVYTDERLKRALDLFRDSDPYRRRRGLPGSNLGSFLESRSKQYETRSGKASLTVRTTYTGVWNDKDDSDDYRPGKKRIGVRPQKPVQNNSKRKPPDDIKKNEDKSPKRIKASYTTGRHKGLSLEVRFKFSTDAAKAKIAGLFPGTTSDTDLTMNGHSPLSTYDEHDRELNKPPSSLLDNTSPSSLQPAATTQSRTIPGQSPLIKGTQAQFVSFTAGSFPSEPAHRRQPTADESDPIIIDDSDDLLSDDGGLLHETELYQLVSQTKIIKTNWAHPVDYRCAPEACNFCQDFRYPLFGCGPVKIEVIQLAPGVYEEMGGGHRERGMAPTKICLNCSLERIAIAKCPCHDMLLIDGYSEEEFDHQSFLKHITSPDYPMHPNCSVCIEPAFYACATKQKEDAFGIPVTGKEVYGCGLLLCNDCARIVVSNGLNMQRLEEFAQSSKMLRADREFLLPGSDLWQAWMS